MKKMLLLALAMGCGAFVYATPQGMENFAENLQDELQRQVANVRQSEDGQESFERNGEFLFLDQNTFTLNISMNTDPQVKNRNKEQQDTDFRVNIYQGSAGAIYIKRYPEGVSAAEVFNARPSKKCTEISILPDKYVVSGTCKYDDADVKTYSVSKFITQGHNVYEFTYVTSQKFMQDSANFYLPGQLETKILAMVLNTSNETITNFFRSDLFVHGYDYPRLVEK